MKTLVCGGRAYGGATPYAAYNHISAVLDAIHQETPITLLISGGAPGVDSLCEAWAKARGVDMHIYVARWKTEGRSAGPRRNQRVLDVEHKPDDLIKLCVAFDGGAGTADMVSRVRENCIRLLLPDQHRS